MTEEPRDLTPEDAGRYFDEFEGMKVADAICPACQAEYLAWVEPSENHRETNVPDSSVEIPIEEEKDFYDLSYRTTFNDETFSPKDLPKYQVKKKVQWVRKGKTKYHPEKRND